MNHSIVYSSRASLKALESSAEDLREQFDDEREIKFQQLSPPHYSLSDSFQALSHSDLPVQATRLDRLPLSRMNSTIKAWVHHTPPFPTTLKQIDIPLPSRETLGANEILVEICSAALNPVDVQIANLSIFRLPALQANRGLGKDFSGKLLSKGRDVKDEDLEVGDEIMGVTLNPVSFDFFHKLLAPLTSLAR